MSAYSGAGQRCRGVETSLETDSVGAVSKLKKLETDRSILGPLVEEIKMLGEFEASSIEHVRRHKNEVLKYWAQN
jgi:hypothetical protein